MTILRQNSKYLINDLGGNKPLLSSRQENPPKLRKLQRRKLIGPKRRRKPQMLSVKDLPFFSDNFLCGSSEAEPQLIDKGNKLLNPDFVQELHRRDIKTIPQRICKRYFSMIGERKVLRTIDMLFI